MPFIPDYPPLFWFTAIFALILLGISKAGFGGGAGAIVTPLMSLVIPVADAAALLLVLLIIIDFVMLPHYRHHFHRPSLKYMLIGAMIGISIGGLAFKIFSEHERWLQIFIGVFALLYVAYSSFNFQQKLGNLAETRLLRPMGIILGALAGFISTLAHAGGPPATIYLLPQKHSKEVFVGTMAIFFTIVNLTKLIPYSMLGLIRVGNVTTILLLSPVCFIGAQLGIYLNKRFDPLWFNRIIYVLLFLTGLQLLVGESLIKLFLP